MKRREFIAIVSSSALVWPLASSAQKPGRLPRIGILVFGTAAEFGRLVHAFSVGMVERGYQDGKNVQLVIRYSDQNTEKLTRNARELAAANVDLIWVPGSTVAQAAREATATIPIVFAIVSDPVHSGLVRSLASPGTNMTGLSLLSPEMWGKRLELLFEVRADVRRLGVLSQPGEPASEAQLPHIQKAAELFGRETLVVGANSAEDIPVALARLKEWRAEALVFAETGLFLVHHKSLIDEATKNRWPTVNSTRQYVEVGGLISYGVDYLDSCRRSAEYVERILKGAKPADLPVQQPTKFELVINMKAAKALGIRIPPSLLARADEVIE
jgi:putative tryptophan/tyrosine transport system substrate-binding protein